MARYLGTNLVAGDFPGFSSSQNAAINSGITQSLVDDTVYKSTAQTISGNKTFSGNNTFSGTNTFSNTNTFTAIPVINNYLYFKGLSTTAGAQSVRDIEFHDTNNVRVSGIRAEKSTTERRQIGLYVCDTNNTNKGGLTLSCASDGSDLKLSLPANVYGTTFNGTTFTGTANRALYADLAEMYRSDEEYPIGTLIKFGGEKDITLADTEVNGAISDKPGYLLDESLEGAQPVALVGKTPIRIIGQVKKFDKIVLSEQYLGMGRVQNYSGEKVIAIALESSTVEEEKLIMCVTKFRLD